MSLRTGGISTVTHPRYSESVTNWFKWRLAMRGGEQFVRHYLKRLSKREEQADYLIRKSISYCPAFSKSGIREVVNSIYQRMIDISRVGGSPSYQRAICGLDHGVDKVGSTMNGFIGQQVLPELLVMRQVGVFVDMDPVLGDTLVEAQGKRPYIYTYEAEDIRSWTNDETNSPNEYSSILLRDYVYEYDEETGLPKGQVSRFRRLWLNNGRVWAKFYNQVGEPAAYSIYEKDEPIILDIDRIPFYMFEISDSLMADIADYQIALLNLASSDMAYALKSNYPFYTEQFDQRVESSYLKPEGGNGEDPNEVRVGAASGRRYPSGMDRPQFIHPSPEPLKVSMEKQTQLKEEIRQLLHLAVANLQTRQTSAESKGMDDRSLESGLSAIGLELEAGERQIASFWSMLEGSSDVADIKYPEKYELKTADERRKDADQLASYMNKVPSLTYKKEIAKRFVRVVLGARASHESLETIDSEINAAVSFDTDAKNVASDVENGLVSLEFASQLRGYPSGEVDKAKEDHAERLLRIAQSQQPGKGLGATVDPNLAARGVTDLAVDPKGGSREKKNSRDNTTKPTPYDATRGNGK